MKWEAPSVSRFAADAGFVRPDLHTATSIALAATNGIDHYDVAVGIPGAGRYVGLWAINIDEWPEYDPRWLIVPENAARAAYDLTVRNSGFGWSAVWRAGTDRHYLDHAATAHTTEPFRELPSSHIRVRSAQTQIDALGQRLGRLTQHG